MVFNFSTWLPESLFTKDYLSRDIIAGTTIAMIIIPQSMAYATLADVPPVYGLYAALLPVAIAALFGSSRYLATGPVAMVCLLTSVAISSLSFGDSSLYIAYAVILAMTVGLFQIALALVRAGKIFDTIPEHVLLGFTSAAALIIATSQLSKVFGLPKISLNELLNISDLLNKTPIINIIDEPILPLKSTAISKNLAGLVGGFLGGFLCLIFLIFRKIFENS